MDRLKLVKEENEEENEEEDEEEDNLLTYLAVLFGQVTLGDSSPADSHEVRREEELASPPDSEHASSTSPLLGEGCSTPKANSSNLCPDFSSDSLQQANRAGALPSPITTNNHEQSQELPSLATNEPILSQGTPTSSVPDLEASIGQSPLECEGARETLSDTHTERADSAPSTPKDGASVLPGSIKEEENDDPLACLADQLAGTTLDGTDDTGRRVRSERVEDELTRPSPPKLEIDDKSQIKTKMSSVPSTPASKALDGRYYFCALSGVYYFDNYHNVFFHDGTLVHDGSDAPDWDDLLTPHFYLDEVPFWFDNQGLLYQGTDGNIYHADVWQSEQQSDQLGQSQDFGGLQAPQVDTSVFQDDLSHQSCNDPQFLTTSMADFDGLNRATKVRGQLRENMVETSTLQVVELMILSMLLGPSANVSKLSQSRHIQSGRTLTTTNTVSVHLDGYTTLTVTGGCSPKLADLSTMAHPVLWRVSQPFQTSTLMKWRTGLGHTGFRLEGPTVHAIPFIHG
ncbi:hypothetical protein B0J17DRAFT_412149 [Rhizoctonia solani]|nr:hypothetical protein B0J17DRAFT_412149 [Rhizoctonia solani]